MEVSLENCKLRALFPLSTNVLRSSKVWISYKAIEKDMPSLKPSELIALLGIALSLIAILFSVGMAQNNFFDAASYTNLLPSITYIAVAVSFVALAESFDLALLTNNDDINDTDRSGVIMQFAVNMTMSLIYLLVFCINSLKLSQPSYTASFGEILASLGMILLASILVITMKRRLEALK